MKGKLLRITAGKVTRVLGVVGFVLVRQSGSHRIYKKIEGMRATVPTVSLKKVPRPKVLKSILIGADLTVEQFRELVE